MTLIIGIEDGNKSWLMSDSGMWNRYERHVTTQPKIWKSGDWIVGSAGRLGDAQIIRQFPIPDPAEFSSIFGNTIEDNETHVLIDWADSLQTHLNRYRERMNVVAQKEDCDSGSPTIVAARAGRVYHIEHCEVSRSLQGFAVCGAATFGYGAIHGARAARPGETPPPFDTAMAAMTAAYRATDMVFGPIVWLCTDGASGAKLAVPNSFEQTIGLKVCPDGAITHPPHSANR